MCVTIVKSKGVGSMKKRLLLLIPPVIAFILELLPYGVIMKFADGPDSTYTETFSYFSLLPFGYAVFGPLIAAVLTCALFAVTAIYVFTGIKGLKTAVMVIVMVTALLSVSPALYGLEYLSLINAVVSLILSVEAVVLLIQTKPA